jgi:DNA-binding transcriptional regulator YbjK
MPKGILDPDRRNRIARAAVDVVAQKGLADLTHRAVASAAHVPLGSTTYHFTSREDLLLAAVELTKARWDAAVAAWALTVSSTDDLASALADLIVEMTGDSRDEAVVEYELYVAALRRPSLQLISEEWDDALRVALKSHTDDVAAYALALAVDGLVLRLLISGEPANRTDVEQIFERILRT